MYKHIFAKDGFLKSIITMFLQNSTKCPLSKLSIERKSLNLAVYIWEKLTTNITNNVNEIKAMVFPVSISVCYCNAGVSCKSQKKKIEIKTATKKQWTTAKKKWIKSHLFPLSNWLLLCFWNHKQLREGGVYCELTVTEIP